MNEGTIKIVLHDICTFQKLCIIFEKRSFLYLLQSDNEQSTNSSGLLQQGGVWGALPHVWPA